MELEQKEFETWLDSTPEGHRLSNEKEGSRYRDSEVQILWECWQAGYQKGSEAAW